MNKITTIAVAGAALMLSAATASAKTSPSFNCHYAGLATERAICANNRLSRLDNKLDYWFAKAKLRAGHFDQTAWLVREQRTWLRRRNACGRFRFCISWRYRQRIRELRRYFTHV